MPDPRPRRSLLYMPGANARALAKAAALACDGVILDLEDAVAPQAKALARDQVAAAVAGRGFGFREVVVRVNAPASPWFEADLAAIAAAGPDAVLLPKVESPETLLDACRRLEALGAGPGIAVWAMIETPLAVLKAEPIAAAARAPGGRRIAALVAGTNDLAKETGARLVAGRAPMAAWLSLVVAAARAHGLAALDGVFNDLADEAGFAAECAEGRDFGFDGKTLIHPAQIAAANAAFAPDPAEVARAAAILAAFAAPENAGAAVIALEGRMVERLHAEIAARTVALARAIAARG